MLDRMLVSDFIHIDRPFAVVRDAVLACGPAWLADSAVAAYEQTEQASLRIFSSIGPLRLSKRVWAEVSEPSLRNGHVTQRLSWRATGATHLFPTMEADIEVAPLGDAMTSITFQGRYEPPLGPLGREVDRMLLHRVVEASVRALLTRVTARLMVAAGAAVAYADGADPVHGDRG